MITPLSPAWTTGWAALASHRVCPKPDDSVSVHHPLYPSFFLRRPPTSALLPRLSPPARSPTTADLPTAQGTTRHSPSELFLKLCSRPLLRTRLCSEFPRFFLARALRSHSSPSVSTLGCRDGKFVSGSTKSSCGGEGAFVRMETSACFRVTAGCGLARGGTCPARVLHHCGLGV